MPGQIGCQDGGFAGKLRAPGKYVITRRVGNLAVSRAGDTIPKPRSVEGVLEPGFLQEAHRVFTHELGFVRIGVQAASDDDGRRVIRQSRVDRPGLFGELRRGEFAFEDVDLDVAFGISAGHVIFDLNGENDDDLGADPNRGTGQSSGRSHRALRFPRLGPGQDHGSSGENGDLGKVRDFRESGTGRDLITGRCQQRRKRLAGLPVGHRLQDNDVGVE